MAGIPKVWCAVRELPLEGAQDLEKIRFGAFFFLSRIFLLFHYINTWLHFSLIQMWKHVVIDVTILLYVRSGR